MNYFRHRDRTWDTLTSTLYPQLLAKSGWIEITKDEYESIRLNNEQENIRWGR